jgi:hypothetical protein
MRYIQKAICGAKTFFDTPIYSQLQNIIFTTVEDQLNISALEKLGPSKLVMVGGCSNQNYIDL